MSQCILSSVVLYLFDFHFMDKNSSNIHVSKYFHVCSECHRGLEQCVLIIKHLCSFSKLLPSLIKLLHLSKKYCFPSRNSFDSKCKASIFFHHHIPFEALYRCDPVAKSMLKSGVKGHKRFFNRASVFFSFMPFILPVQIITQSYFISKQLSIRNISTIALCLIKSFLLHPVTHKTNRACIK